jgi:uncharacterized UPF0160 family protein
MQGIMLVPMELNEQTLEEILARQTGEFTRRMDANAAEMRLHFDVVGEALRSDIKGIAEGHELLREDLQRQREEFTDALATQSRDLGMAIRSVADDVRDVRHHVEAIETDVEVIKTDIEIMKSELAIIRSDLKQKVGRDEFAVLEARVALLERASRRQ